MSLQSFYVFNIVLFFKLIFVVSSKHSLTFVIDDTRSMQFEIRNVENAVNIIMDHSEAVDKFVLVTFNDPGKRKPNGIWGPCGNTTSTAKLRINTTYKKELTKKLKKINTHVGGGDKNGECSLSGIKLGLENTHRNSCMFVFTDDVAKDKSLLGNVIENAQRLQTKVVIVLTRDDCPKYPEYSQIIKSTNGKLLCLTGKRLTGISNHVPECFKGR